MPVDIFVGFNGTPSCVQNRLFVRVAMELVLWSHNPLVYYSAYLKNGLQVGIKMPVNRLSTRSIFFVFLFVVVVLLINGLLLNHNFRNVSENEAWVAHTHGVLNELQATAASARDAEVSMSKYNGEAESVYLDRFERNNTDAIDHIQNVRDLTKDNVTQQENLDSLEKLLQKKFKVLADTREYKKSGVVNSATRTRLDKENEAAFESLLSKINEMKNHETRLLEVRAQASEQSKSIFFLVLILTTVLSVGTIFVAFWQIERFQKRSQVVAAENAMISDIAQLGLGSDNASELGERIISFLIKKMGFLAGRILIVEENGSASSIASVGAKEISGMNHSAVSASLIGAALLRKETWIVKDVPKDFWHITSSLGEASPRLILLGNITFQGNVIGVLEMAAFDEISEFNERMISKSLETIGISLNAALTRGKLQSLLEKTQYQSEELQAQQEELRTSNEELEQQARALENQQEILQGKNTELGRIQQDLQAKAEDLARSTQYKSDFMAKMSHELRTPLNGLMILSTLLVENKEGTLTPQQREFARSINSAGTDLLSLINDILDLSKIEARKLSLRPEKFTLKDLFQSKRRTFTPQTTAKNLNFVTQMEPQLEKMELFTDRQRVEQILRNFIANAIKFTEKGSITLDAKYEDSKKEVTLSVTDTGVGIPESKQGLIFEAFEQADSSISRKYGGTGLGLTISRELAALLGGRIHLKSTENKGSTFSLTIPIFYSDANSVQANVVSSSHAPLATSTVAAEIEPPAIARDSKATTLAAEAAIRGVAETDKSILIVEDDHGFREAVASLVKSVGFEPLEAEDGEVALAILERHLPSAMLLDIKLPGISGLGILETIKKSPRLRHIPVHMISALDYQQNALRMGALGYLTKPVTTEKVRSAISRIENLLSKRMRSVLLIEDDETQSKAVSELISGDDIEVKSVKTGKQAVEQLKTEGFDCVILDLTLPDVSGFDLLEELRGMEISLPPIVIYTGKDLSLDEESYLRRFSESIIIKGARSPERLLDEVNLFLHRVESLLPIDKREMLAHLRSQNNVFKGKTILVVDDDIRNIFALTSALEGKEIEVRVARNGLEAVESVKQHHDIDLVLMDIMMPKMDGFEAMRLLRSDADPRVRKVPIVALTAKAMKEDHEKCMEAGANDYLPKPINLDNLMTVLSVWLGQKSMVE